MAKFQIRDDTFGLALYEGETARDALLEFITNRARAELGDLIRVDGDVATVEFAGETYRAVPIPTANDPPGG